MAALHIDAFLLKLDNYISCFCCTCSIVFCLVLFCVKWSFFVFILTLCSSPMEAKHLYISQFPFVFRNVVRVAHIFIWHCCCCCCLYLAALFRTGSPNGTFGTFQRSSMAPFRPPSQFKLFVCGSSDILLSRSRSRFKCNAPETNSLHIHTYIYIYIYKITKITTVTSQQQQNTLNCHRTVFLPLVFLFVLAAHKRIQLKCLDAK